MMDLRSSKPKPAWNAPKSALPDATKTSIKSSSILKKASPSTASIKGSKQPTANAQEILNISKMVHTAMEEIVHLKDAFIKFQNSVEQSIDSMHTTINGKSKSYESITGTLTNEINAMKKSLQTNGEVIKQSSTVSMDATFTHILHGNALLQLEREYIAQIEQLRCKVNEIEKANEQTAETVNDLVTSISTCMNTSPCEYDAQCSEKIGDIENSIECIQHEINRMKTSSFVDDEKLIKMNKQIHVLSSKYVDFNIKINRHLLDFNRTNLNKIKSNKIIDEDTKAFMIAEESSDMEIDNINSMPLEKLSSFRFGQPIMGTDYTRVVRVNINGANTKNLEKFKVNFKAKFEECIGKNTVKRVSIIKYRMQNDDVNYIGCVVEFEVPLGYSYINNHKFPANWDFSPIHKHNHTKRVMTSRMRHQMKRTMNRQSGTTISE